MSVGGCTLLDCSACRRACQLQPISSCSTSGHACEGTRHAQAMHLPQSSSVLQVEEASQTVRRPPTELPTHTTAHNTLPQNSLHFALQQHRTSSVLRPQSASSLADPVNSPLFGSDLHCPGVMWATSRRQARSQRF